MLSVSLAFLHLAPTYSYIPLHNSYIILPFYGATHSLSGNDTSEGDIRLVGGTNHWEGRVEVFLSREWGTVYDYRAYTADAVVVCRQLGYSVKGQWYAS